MRDKEEEREREKEMERETERQMERERESLVLRAVSRTGALLGRVVVSTSVLSPMISMMLFSVFVVTRLCVCVCVCSCLYKYVPL